MTLSEFGRSDAMIGTAEVFNQAPWLVAAVQFFISWAVIAGFIMFYFSYLCTLVFLSNKEFFRSVDEIKKGDQGEKRLSVKDFMNAFRATGGERKQRLTGLDNVVVFVMMIIPNFLAYSMYADVKEGEDSTGQRFNYNDTMGQFFLKSLPQSVMILFILGMALTGLLLRILFQLSDGLTIFAADMSNRHLAVAIDRFTGGRLLYNFDFVDWQTVPGDMANQVARTALLEIISTMPHITQEQTHAVGEQIQRIVSQYMTNPQNQWDPGPLVDLYNRFTAFPDPIWTDPGERMIRESAEAHENRHLQSGFRVDVRVTNTIGAPVSFYFDLNDVIANAGFSHPGVRNNIVNVYVRYDLAQLRRGVGALAQDTGAAGGTLVPQLD